MALKEHLPAVIGKLCEQARRRDATTCLLNDQERSQLLEWCTSDGCEIVASAEEGGIAINIANLMLYHCSDEMICDHIGVDYASEVSDDDRVDFVREYINGETLLDDGVTAPSVHCLRLEKNSDSPFFGCLIEIHGQAGPVPVWAGLFAGESALEQCLRDEGHWLFDKVDVLEDTEILEEWKRYA